MSFAERLKKYRPSPVTLIMLGLIAYVWFRPPAWVTDEQQVAPPLLVRLTDGRMLNLADLRGKVVLVNFWATWCPYCRHEMPAMQRFYQDYKDKGFELLALSQDEDAAKVFQFLRDEGYSFPVAMEAPGTSAAFGGVTKLPTSFVIDKHGMVRKKISGQMHYARLEELVLPLLKE
jgi:thiol-disulfide isomerase/thioredoxin